MPTKERITTPDQVIWRYSFFREYVLAAARDNRFIPASKQFPQQIELSCDWHTLFSEMRQNTRAHGNELYVIVASNGAGLFLGTKPGIGRSDCVPDQLIMGEVAKTNKLVGQDTAIGDIHSHPHSWFRDWKETDGVGKQTYEQGLPSITDVQQLVASENHFFKLFGMVVSPYWNACFFRTKLTEDISGSALRQEDTLAFEKYWYQEYGAFGYTHENTLDSRELFGGSSVREWKVYKGIGKKHNLVFYKGKPGENLIRIFPAITNSIT